MLTYAAFKYLLLRYIGTILFTKNNRRILATREVADKLVGYGSKKK